MKIKYVFWLIAFLLIVITSCKKEIPVVTGFKATEGTRVGVVRLTYEPASGADAYEIQRKNPETNTWEQIAYIKSWVPDHVFDDRGLGLLNNTLIPGQLYEYRMQTYSSEGSGHSPWSSTVTGYIFAPSPRMTKVNYVPDENPENDGVFTFTFKDKLPSDLSNLNNRKIKIFRAKATTSYYSEFYSGLNIIGTDSTIFVTCSEDINDAPYDYKFGITYNYKYAIVDEEGSNLNGNADYVYQSLIITDDDLNTTETVTYNVLNFNEINSSATGAKNEVIMCKDGTTAYLGYLDNYNLLGNGKPKLMKNTGLSWEFAGGTLPSEILNNNAIDEFDFTVSAGIIYLAAISADTLIIYKYDGTWSANLTTPVLWGYSALQYFNIAVLNNEYYVSVIQGNDVKVFKYTGSDWIQVGSTIASGSYSNIKLKEIDGVLYTWYEEASGGTETTLHIKHWNGASWFDDLQWTQDAATDFDVIKAGSNLYFKCAGLSSDFLGGVYKVTSSTTVSNLFEEGALLHTPTSITANASGNIIASIVNGTYVTNFQLGVFIYDGSVWKQANDNYSEVSIIGYSNGVQAINNDIHFVYGLKSSENESGVTILKAKKYSK